MPKNSFFGVLGAVTALAATGCSSTRVVKDDGLEKLAPGKSGVLFLVDKQLPDESSRYSMACSLNLRRLDGIVDESVEVDVGLHATFLELPPGQYRFHSLFCAGGTWDVARWLFLPFEAKAGKVAIVGPIELRFWDAGKAEFGFRSADHMPEVIQAQKSRFPKEAQARLFSGWLQDPNEAVKAKRKSGGN